MYICKISAIYFTPFSLIFLDCFHVPQYPIGPFPVLKQHRTLSCDLAVTQQDRDLAVPQARLRTQRTGFLVEDQYSFVGLLLSVPLELSEDEAQIRAAHSFRLFHSFYSFWIFFLLHPRYSKTTPLAHLFEQIVKLKLLNSESC